MSAGTTQASKSSPSTPEASAASRSRRDSVDIRLSNFDLAALTQIAALGPGIKALVGFVGFVVALISLSALRNFGPVLFYVGLAIFAAVGLVIAGAIMGAVI